MPQMAPLNWLTLFVLFSIYVLILSSINYFFLDKTSPTKFGKIKKSLINWSW